MSICVYRRLSAVQALWGFSPQKPMKRAYEQQPELVARWLREKYPAIVRQARQEKAEIYWGTRLACPAKMRVVVVMPLGGVRQWHPIRGNASPPA